MPILKVDSKRKDYKLVGIELPPQDHLYLSLFCLSKRISKSKVLRALFDDWFMYQRGKQSQKAMINEIARQIEERWDEMKLANPKLSQEEYKKTVEAELQSKLPEKIVAEILKIFK